MLSKRKKHLAAKITLGLVFSLSFGIMSVVHWELQSSLPLIRLRLSAVVLLRML